MAGRRTAFCENCGGPLRDDGHLRGGRYRRGGRWAHRRCQECRRARHLEREEKLEFLTTPQCGRELELTVRELRLVARSPEYWDNELEEQEMPRRAFAPPGSSHAPARSKFRRLDTSTRRLLDRYGAIDMHTAYGRANDDRRPIARWVQEILAELLEG